jgi:putative oxidoreductase
LRNQLLWLLAQYLLKGESKMEIGLLVIRVVVGALFVGHGSQKLFGAFGGHGLQGTAGFMESLGMKPGKRNAFLAGSAELVGGALLALGLVTPLAAALLISVMVVATVTVHLSKGVWNSDGGYELPLVFVAAVFAITAIGAGPWSLDDVLGLDVTGAGWALAALGAGLVGGLGAIVTGRLASGHSAHDAHPSAA